MYAEEQWMQRAMKLAERGRGYVEPNPLVGAVIVREGKIVGEGWHERFGQAHAEINALRQAGSAACGATLYLTLEPCCHQGITPPCTDAVIAAGIRRVVASMEDPFPQVAGKGGEQLRAAGIEVEFGICEEPIRRQNAPYLKLLKKKQPYVHAKWAMTLDGKIATRSGDSKWISNESSRRRVHELRGRMDAVITGIGTVLADDPLLTARPPGPRVATRVVLDSEGRIPLDSQLVRTARQFPTVVITSQGASETAIDSLERAGCEVVSLPDCYQPDIAFVLHYLGNRRMTNVLIEAGPQVLGSFVDIDAIDEIHVFIGPRIAGGNDAKSPVGGRGVGMIKEALRFDRFETEMIDGDIYWHGWPVGQQQLQ